MPQSFVHLHVHTQYSMLDGAIRVHDLAKQTKALGMSAVAITDHGNMFGALQHFKACKAEGIHPILGCEVNVVARQNGSDAARNPHESHHMVLLATNQVGYQNLVRIVSEGWVHGMVRNKPCVTLDTLRPYATGLIALTGCMGGHLAHEVLMRGEKSAEPKLFELMQIFDDGSLFVELQDHGLPEQTPLNRILVRLAKRVGAPLVATNDCHYLEKAHARAWRILQCIGAGAMFADADKTGFSSAEMYLKSPKEMAVLFKDLPEAIHNTMSIAERCQGVTDADNALMLGVNPFAKPKLPRFAVPEGYDESSYLRKLAHDGLSRRLKEIRKEGRSVDEAMYRAQVDMECDVICGMGFAGYFLIVQDFINWAKERNIPVGPGRGSGAGSIVAYGLRITDLDPIRYGLLFERFLNPERVSMPDFDIDFCMHRRDEVLEYVRSKYGATSVGQIATFHLLKSRSVVRDVGRVMGLTPQEAGRIATLVPEPVQGKSIPIAKAIEQEKRLKTLYEQDAQAKAVLDAAMSLEELTRHAGMHAAGVVIAEGHLWDHVPVFCPEEGTYVTQYHKDDVEEAGLVKFDFLGLKTLTVMHRCMELVEGRYASLGQATPFSLETLDLNDKATYALLQSGETTGVFQLESSGMQTLFKQLKPDCFEDIVAAVALYRPGPLGSGMVEDFVQRKHRRVKVEYPHPSLESILTETYGVIVYQEQVMQAAQKMAGYSLGKADILRRAMGKKKPEEMAKQKADFIAGAVESGFQSTDAERVFELINYFAGYGFNKSHSAAYALITYQTAYLKAHYPAEFMCATLSADRDKIDKVVRGIAEARAMGIKVLPPDVNESDTDFTVVYGDQPAIRFGLGAIKGVGAAAVEAIFEARQGNSTEGVSFTDLLDFTARVDLRRVNKSVIEALIQCGALDAIHQPLGISRASALASIEAAIEQGKRVSSERLSGQTSLFGADASPMQSAQRRYVDAQGWDTQENLRREKATLGIYLSGHPLERYALELKRCGNADTASVRQMNENAKVRIGGTVEEYRERPTRSGGKIAFFNLEDTLGRVEVIVRPQWVGTVREILAQSEPVLISGIVQFEGNHRNEDEELVQAKIVLEDAQVLAHALHAQAKWAVIHLEATKTSRAELNQLQTILNAHPGPCPCDLELRGQAAWRTTLKRIAFIAPSDELLSAIERSFGENVCEFRWPMDT